MGKHNDTLSHLVGLNRELREHIPDVFTGFAQMGRVLQDGVLPRKIKELIALGIGISEQCDGCIASHARGAARAGATPEEVAEAIGVAIFMGGGPGTVYGPRAWEAYKEFADQQSSSGG